MADTMRDRPSLPLPDKSGPPLQAQIRKADPAADRDLRKADPDDRQARRAVLAAVLYDALLILKLPRLKQQADFLKRDPRTLRAWFDGKDPIPWEELLAIRALQFPLMQALLESCQADLVEIRTSISRKAAA